MKEIKNWGNKSLEIGSYFFDYSKLYEVLVLR